MFSTSNNSSYETLSSTMSKNYLMKSSSSTTSTKAPKSSSMMRRVLKALKEPLVEDPATKHMSGLDQLNHLRGVAGPPQVKVSHHASVWDGDTRDFVLILCYL
ncbi:BZ3500_MvSof-1268-A1-R1_Chr3-1g05943 [Microbotryum saponariae]|uniref:BZ3500_MvSof-1268-A1-R1_Chr3-1g05943 protein n=1 Tax=Microbotryum saponariae TaxID=289078 RepID=A0A2X0M004_9BASI|nr:BZ3500_MvSof-1268-A1-R1_Chr3-1g05943 [Microbotryum saponariae]SDA05133.1 BZ3501_MvSof-1269-A2-R1_Chr3-1g05613 [Microbotryum saponariae]